MSTLLAKWLNGTATPKEIELLQSEYDLEELSQVLKAQESLGLETVDSGELWNGILDKNTSLNKSINSSKKKFWTTGLIILSLLLISLFFLIDNRSSIHAPKGQTIEHIMADNSKIILSPNSQILYKEEGWKNNRTIELSGQAYFQVEKGSEFSVMTPEGKVTVIGTEFEVRESDNFMQVQCMEGSVRFESSADKYVILNQGDKAIMNNSVISSVQKHDLNHAEFLSGKIKYENIPPVELSKEIERFYNIDVTLKENIGTQKFTGILLLDDLDKAISYISKTMDWQVQKDTSKITFYN